MEAKTWFLIISIIVIIALFIFPIVTKKYIFLLIPVGLLVILVGIESYMNANETYENAKKIYNIK
jgi:hypothetical protein